MKPSRLPIPVGLRSNDAIKLKLDTTHGRISEPMFSAILTADRWHLEQLVEELGTAALMAQDLLDGKTPGSLIKLNAHVTPSVPSVPVTSNFGVDTFPKWVVEFLTLGDVQKLRSLSQEQADQQMRVVICKITSITPGGKMTWNFLSNLDKTGYGFVPSAHIHSCKEGDYWCLQHNGGNGLDSIVLGGIKLTEQSALDSSSVLSKVWRHFHPK